MYGSFRACLGFDGGEIKMEYFTGFGVEIISGVLREAVSLFQ